MRAVGGCLGALVAGLMVTASCAQTTSSNCTPIPDAKSAISCLIYRASCARHRLNLQRRHLHRLPAPKQMRPDADGGARGGVDRACRCRHRRICSIPIWPACARTASRIWSASTAAWRNHRRIQGCCRKNAQNVIGNHGPLDLAEWDKTMDEAITLGQEYIGSAGFGDPGFKSLEDTLTTASNLNTLGKAAADKG